MWGFSRALTFAILLQLGVPQARALVPFEARVEGRLRKNVDFWVDIYSRYTSRQGLIHDSKYVNLVYEVVDLDHKSGPMRIRDAKLRWKKALLSTHRKWIKSPESPPEALGLDEDERRVYELFRDVRDPDKFFQAAHRKRLRFQLGQKDRFLEGLTAAGRYLPMMEEIFKKEGLPPELTRLPFVESSFNLKARSKVGASGIWQFMRSTGKLYLTINEQVDERNDPIRATEAAAKLLKANYESLQSWPLAVTAYNHGRKGLMRAVRKVGSTELRNVVEDYRSRNFGFASGNFFVELLAALEVERNSEKYFGPVARDKPVDALEVRLPDSVPFRELCRFLKLDPRGLRALNPGLSEGVFAGNSWVPAGYRLRLAGSAPATRELATKVFFTGYREIPSIYKRRGQNPAGYDK